MAVQRSIWKPIFRFWPSLSCPSCKVGKINIVKSTISKEETASSKVAHHHEEWQPDWFKQRFIAILHCANPRCRDSVFVCGEVTIGVDFHYEAGGTIVEDWIDLYVPRYFEPAPPVFPIPDECPEEVGDELKKAFALVWSDVGSAGNRLRVAVEALMNERTIQKRAKIKQGQNKWQFNRLTLDDRIKKFAEKHEDAAKQLMAIKWLGNTASHAALDVLTHDDLLDAFEHFEYALDLVYVNKTLALVKRAEHIIKKKGPVRAKPKRKR